MSSLDGQDFDEDAIDADVDDVATISCRRLSSDVKVFIMTLMT